MKYFIDQSIKIENTNKASYVGLANSQVTISSISARDKKRLKTYFRKLDKPLIFKLFTFSVLVARVLEETEVSQVTIDQEYRGHEIDIGNFVVQILSSKKKVIPEINFHQIGKRNNAHCEVYRAQKKNLKGHRVSAEVVIENYRKISK